MRAGVTRPPGLVEDSWAGPGPATVPGAELSGVLAQHVRRGLAAQRVFRLLLTGLVLGVAISVPAGSVQRLCLGIGAAHLVWTAATALLARRPAPAQIGRTGSGLLVDLLAVLAVTLAARSSAPVPWSAEALVHVLFLLPVLAALLLRLVVCGVVGASTVLVHLSLRLTEPGGAAALPVLLSPTLALAGLALGCLLVCGLHRSQVFALFHLAADRARRGEEEVDIERRERRLLADHLRTEVLQPLRAARHDLDLAPDGGAAQQLGAERLRSVTAVLASALVALDPVLLRRAGLPAALHQLVTALPLLPGQVVRLRTDGWPDDLRTAVDPVLYGAARAMLVAVLEHDQACVVEVELGVVDRVAVLEVHDGGAGAAAHLLTAPEAEPPLGLASRRSRLEAAGGELHLQTGDDGCTVARASLPLPLGCPEAGYPPPPSRP